MTTRRRARLFAKYALEKRCIARSLKVALLVGTVLALINHYDSIISASFSLAVTLQILVTYAVPYSVSTFGSAMQAVQMEMDAENKKGDVEGPVKTVSQLSQKILPALSHGG